MHYTNAKSILSSLNGMNIYRGCTHGCIYCDSRSLCYHTPIPFEDIIVKQNAPELLEDRLKRKRSPCIIGTGAMCDPYMHCEKQLLLTRKCLEIIDRYGFGVAVQTKSDLIMRDIDLLESINRKAKCVVQLTLTTKDDDLCRIIEPDVCVTSRRVEVLKEMKKRNIPTVVWLSPFLPFINDSYENFDGLLQDCLEAGVKGIICFGIGVTMREGNREYFYSQLDRHFPGLRERYERTYGNTYSLVSPENNRIMKHFNETCSRYGIIHTPEECFEYMREFPSDKAVSRKTKNPLQGEFDF